MNDPLMYWVVIEGGYPMIFADRQSVSEAYLEYDIHDHGSVMVIDGSIMAYLCPLLSS